MSHSSTQSILRALFATFALLVFASADFIGDVP